MGALFFFFYPRIEAYLLCGLLVLPEEMVEYRPVLFVYPLHLVDVFCHLLHPREGLGQVLLLVRPVRGQGLELLQQQRVLEDPLDGLDEVRLQRRGVLLPGVERVKELLEALIALVCGNRITS